MAKRRAVDPVSRRVWRGLFRAGSRLRYRVGQELPRWDLTGPQFFVLRSLHESAETPKRMPLSAIGDRLCVTRGNVTGLIDRLEERGLVERVPDEKDRRSIYAQLTPAGAELAAEVVPHVQEALTEVLSGLTKDERARLAELLEKLTGMLERQ